MFRLTTAQQISMFKHSCSVTKQVLFKADINLGNHFHKAGKHCGIFWSNRNSGKTHLLPNHTPKKHFVSNKSQESNALFALHDVLDKSHLVNRRQLRNCTEVDKIFEVWDNSRRDPALMPYVVASLYNILISKAYDRNSLLLDLYKLPIYNEFEQELMQNMAKLPRWSLYSLSLLYVKHCNNDGPLAEQLLRQVQQSAPKFKFDLLLKFEYLLRTNNKTSMRSITLEAVKAEIDLRLLQTNSIPEFMTTGSQAVASKERANMDSKHQRYLAVHETALVMNVLAKYKCCHKPLLSSLVTAFNESSQANVLSIEALTKLAESCVVLEIDDVELLSTLSRNMLKKLLEMKGFEAQFLSCFLCSLAHLRWRDKTVIDALVLAWFHYKGKMNWDEDKVCSFHEILTSCAHLQYMPVVLKKWITHIRSYSDEQDKNYQKSWKWLQTMCLKKEKKIWLDLVYSIAALQQPYVYIDDLASVLDKDFIQTIKDTDIESISKVLAINSMAILHNPGYDGPILENEKLEEFTRDLKHFENEHDLKKEKSFQIVSFILAKMGANEKYVKANYYTNLGHIIDLEFYVNSDGEIQLYDLHYIEKKPELLRVAIKLVDSTDRALITGVLIGKAAVDVKHLERLGFCVLLIDRLELAGLENDLQRVMFLQKKIKTLATAQNQEFPVAHHDHQANSDE